MGKGRGKKLAAELLLKAIANKLKPLFAELPIRSGKQKKVLIV
jgi:hypothetical protein